MAVAKHTDSKQNGGPHSQTSNQNCCASCQMPIKDRFVFNLGVIEQNFHQDCVRCADCSSNLNDRCYFYDGKLYCRVDYWRRFGPKCSACQEPIKPTELVQRLKENLVYHLNCFVCQDCKRHLQAGEQLHLIDDKRLLCKRDYMNIAASASKASRTASNATVVGPNVTNNNNNNNNSLHTNNNQGNQENDGALADNMSSASNASEVGGAPQMTGLVGNNISAVTQLAGDEQDDLDDLDDRSSTADGDQSGLDSMQYAGQYAPNPSSGGNHLTPGGKGTEEMLKGAGLVDCGDDLVDANGKRRGPRTTIKPKQLDTLRRAFESAPKPSRAVREQLATETGLNMRVIQVWFQNRRSKERRMKNTNGSARRNFFRSSSRRLRVGPAGANAPTANGAAVLAGAVQQAAANAAANANASPAQQQSLIAGGRSGANKKLNQQQQRQQQQQQQQLSPLDSADGQMGLAPVATAVGAGQPGRQHNSPSEFGGSSSGGFTYFSDSSNQGDAFAINTSGHQQQQPAQQPQPVGAAQQQQQQQYLTQNGSQQGETANLMALGSPSGGAQATSNHHQQHPAGAPQQQAAARSQQQQQYAHQSMKNTPPPPPIYAGGPVAPQPPPPPQQQQQHLLMGAGHPNVGPHPPPLGHPHQHQQHQHQHQHHQQQHQHHQQHLGPNQMMQPSSDPMNMGGILGGHPQGPTMVQW